MVELEKSSKQASQKLKKSTKSLSVTSFTEHQKNLFFRNKSVNELASQKSRFSNSPISQISQSGSLTFKQFQILCNEVIEDNFRDDSYAQLVSTP